MAAFKLLDPKIKFMPVVSDGKLFGPNAVIACLEGNVQSILSAERVALNFLSRLSGIATLTSKYIKENRPYKAKILDTRKTTPGLRILEKYAVATGGGCNHRLGLYDQILIKDNHLKAIDYDWAMLYHAVRKYKKKGVKTEVEVSNLKEFKEAVKLIPDIIMLDNMSVKEIKAAVKLLRSLRSDIKLEVSGGVDLNNVRKIASTGVDMISIGALTHSVKPIDFSLEIIK